MGKVDGRGSGEVCGSDLIREIYLGGLLSPATGRPNSFAFLFPASAALSRSVYISICKTMSSEAREDLPSPGAEEIEINKNKMEGLSHTATGVTISPELFEKLYLTPKTPHADDSYKKFANITPLGLVGFVISTYTFAMILMGWGGSSGFYGELGIFYFVAPLLLTISFICEWIMGNFFSVSDLSLLVRSSFPSLIQAR